MVAASQDTISNLRLAVQSVYDEIEKDPGTKATIEAIEAMRASTGTKPDAVNCSAATASPTAEPVTPPPVVSPIDGTWAVCYNHDEFIAAGPIEDGEDQPENIGCSNYTFRKGLFWMVAQGQQFDPARPGGTFTLDGTTVTLVSPEYRETWRYNWSLYQDTLTFEKLGHPMPTSLVVKPFHKVADAKP